MTRVIAVCNQKGGVGKTTTSVNLAASLSTADCATLLVDLDPQANATSSLGFMASQIEQGRGDIYDALSGDVPVADLILDTALPNLKLLPSSTELVGAELELATASNRERRLESCLAPILSRFQIVLIDSPPSLGILTLNALTAADSVLIPLQTEYMALEGVASLMRTIGLVRQNLNPRLEVEGLLLTMCDPRNNLSNQVADEARAHFQGLVFRSVIPRNVRLSEAPSHGKPVLLYDVSSKGALSYLQLAGELLERMKKDGYT